MAEEYRPGSFVLDADSLTGTVSKMSITTDQKLIFEDTVEIDALGEQNQTLRNEISRNEKVPDGMVKVASLPMMVYLDLRKRGILGDRSALRRWLKTEEARPYRTHWMTS
jgi:hypothetical protein|tara:strand:- start:12830 stop:13159 length:330 start_codon:yes stop_codon:yes gene_type:complete